MEVKSNVREGPGRRHRSVQNGIPCAEAPWIITRSCVINCSVGNLPLMPDVFPDYHVPVLRAGRRQRHQSQFAARIANVISPSVM